jgi:hypothetical protein
LAPASYLKWCEANNDKGGQPAFDVRTFLNRIGAPQQRPEFTQVMSDAKNLTNSVLQPRITVLAGAGLIGYGLLFGKRWAWIAGAAIIAVPHVLGQTWAEIVRL